MACKSKRACLRPPSFVYLRRGSSYGVFIFSTNFAPLRISLNNVPKMTVPYRKTRLVSKVSTCTVFLLNPFGFISISKIAKIY